MILFIDIEKPEIVGVNIIGNTSMSGDDGVLEILADKGTPPYRYSINGSTYQTGNTFTELSVGTYQIYVKDGSNLIDSVSGIQVGGDYLMPPIITAIEITNTSGHANNDGEIIITASGGNPPYQYSIDGIEYQESNTFSNLSAGIYNISIKDTENSVNTLSGVKLSSQTTADIPQINSLNIIDSTNRILSDGSISVFASGGKSPYKYSINDGPYQTSNTFDNLGVGSYDISVRDADNVINKLSGVKLNSFFAGGSSVGRKYYENRGKLQVNVKNVKLKDKDDINEGIKVRVSV
jgi:large repetitive protein